MLPDGTPSYGNRAEAEILLEHLQELLIYTKESNHPLEIAIISPHRLQTKIISDELTVNQEKYELDWENDSFLHLPSKSRVKVDTTHKQKSRQYDISLISFARQEIAGITNREDYIFTAVTRAKFVNGLFFDIASFHDQRKGRRTNIVWKKLLALEKQQRNLTKTKRK